ncbi:MAG TPA: lipopolysaccharide biosynthesis protein [Steroidobacteraceae bacterium]|nr:lipopolysaccharide biosynthesis protein [Steroidobacteraceae bacterium]
MAKGAAWMVFAKLAERSIGLISTLLLARLLVPNDFGIVAMAMSFVALLELLTAFGFDVALIQKQTKSRAALDTAWTYGILTGLAMAALMVALAGPIAAFYREDALTDVIKALAIGSMAQGFQNIGVVAFRMDMRFDKEFQFLVAKKVISFAITIPLAVTMRSYWALVIGQVVGRIAGTVLSYTMQPYRPRVSLEATRELFNFSKWVFLLNCIGYMKERSSDWIIGRISGPMALGTFNISYELASLPSTELAAPINRAVFPAYAKLAHDLPALRREYLSVIAMLLLLTVPAVLGLAASAPLLVPVVLGANWLHAVPVLTLLSFFGLTHLLQSNAQAAFLALGRPDVPTKLSSAQVVLQIATLIPFTQSMGSVGSAWAFVVTAVIMIPITILVVIKMLELRVREFIIAIWRPLTAALAMYFVVAWLAASLRKPKSTIGLIDELLLAIAVGVVVYIGLVWLFWKMSGQPDGPERVVLDRGMQMSRRFLRWPPQSK